MNEVFRFVTVRPVQRAADREVARWSIMAYGEAGEESPLHKALRGDPVAEEGQETERLDPAAVASAFIESSDFVSDLPSLAVPMAELDAWLRERQDRPSPRLLAEELGRLADLSTEEEEGKEKEKGRTPKREDDDDGGGLHKEGIQHVAAFVDVDAYRLERIRVEDSLLAATVIDAPRDDLVRALQIFGLVDRMAASPEELATGDDVSRYLVASAVVLPADVFRSIAELDGAATEAAPAQHMSQLDTGVSEPAQDLANVQAAIPELRNALKAQIARTALPVPSAPAPTLQGGATPVALPVGAGPSPQTLAAVQMPAPSARAPVEPWLLPPAVITALSPLAREQIGAVAGAEVETTAGNGLGETQARPDTQGTGETEQGGDGGGGGGGGDDSPGTDGPPPPTDPGVGPAPTPGPLDAPAKLAELECRAAGLGAKIQLAASSAPDPPSDPVSPAAWKPAAILARVPAIADLRIVRQKLRRYESREIAHIENVLKGESRGRRHRRTDTTETTTTFEEETARESEHELSTTDRFELQTEASETMREDTQLQAGMSVTAAWGPVSTTGNLGYSSSQAKEQSNRTATTFARDTTERTVARLRHRVREQRVTRTLTEIEEINRHEIDNSDAPTGHVVGIYRWVDKVYDAQIYDYGRRLMLDLVLPEPAAFFVHATSRAPQRGLERIEVPARPEVIDEPTKKIRPLSAADITYATYLSWVNTYKVADVEPPPRPFEIVSVAWDEPWRGAPKGGQAGDMPERGAGGKLYYKARRDLKVPPGYEATAFCASISTDTYGDHVYLGVGDVMLQGPSTGQTGAPRMQLKGTLTLKPGSDREVPIVLAVHAAYGYAIAIQLLCERTCEAYRRWQLKTYEAVMRAYYELKSQHDEAVAAAEAQAGVAIQGRNPLENRMVERAELQRGAIAMLTGQRHEARDALTIEGGYPRLDFDQAAEIRDEAGFFEQALEWSQMTYLYYPYFWGSRDSWAEKLAVEDPDPLLAAFLRAGSARLTIPVRPGFELQALHYLGTGNLWHGVQPPQISDPMYLSIIEELRRREVDTEVEIGESWEVRVPTTLVMLQEDAELPDFTAAT